MNNRSRRRSSTRSEKRRPEQEADILERIPIGNTIDDILPHPRLSGRYRVIAAGAPIAIVSATMVGELSLAPGRVLDEGLSHALANESLILAAYDKAVALLAVRNRGTVELQRRLERAGYEAGAVAKAVSRLAEQGFLDDEQLSLQVARARLASGHAGSRRVEQELARMGVARDVAQAAVTSVAEDEGIDEGESALALARRRAGSLRGLEPEVARRRLYGFLARRGFDSAHVMAAVKAALAELEISDEDDER
ncbi:MAG TPA: regulatory protein RecX [Gemmatimonadales bacterium]|nr:regulatory protein RecX [Gemmatimonadales bacterium]